MTTLLHINPADDRLIVATELESATEHEIPTDAVVTLQGAYGAVVRLRVFQQLNCRLMEVVEGHKHVEVSAPVDPTGNSEELDRHGVPAFSSSARVGFDVTDFAAADYDESVDVFAVVVDCHEKQTKLKTAADVFSERRSDEIYRLITDGRKQSEIADATGMSRGWVQMQFKAGEVRAKAKAAEAAEQEDSTE